MKILIFISLLLGGCLTDNRYNNVETKNEVSEPINIFSDEVNKLPLDGSFYLYEFQIKSSLIKNYFNGKKIEVDLVQTFNNLKIFKVEIKDVIPTNVPKYYTFISNSMDSSSFLLPIDFNTILSIDSAIMLGGIYNHREYDYYFIYRLDKEVLKLIFDSRYTNNLGLKIGYYRDDDCLEYQPNRFVYRYDGKRSIFFDGIIKKYCKPGFDRDPELKKPIVEERINIRLDYNGGVWVYNAKSKYEFW